MLLIFISLGSRSNRHEEKLDERVFGAALFQRSNCGVFGHGLQSIRRVAQHAAEIDQLQIRRTRPDRHAGVIHVEVKHRGADTQEPTIEFRPPRKRQRPLQP